MQLDREAGYDINLCKRISPQTNWTFKTCSGKESFKKNEDSHEKSHLMIKLCERAVIYSLESD